MDNNTQRNIENTWNSIAKSFDKTRKKPWEFCVDFLSTIDSSSTIGDFGCGNGRHTNICSTYANKVIALDLSYNLLQIARSTLLKNRCENIEYIHGSLLKIPLKNEMLDAVIAIASIHNIAQRENRIKALSEINRILKKDSTSLISVWSKHQKRYQITKTNLIKTYHLEKGDRIVYWNQDDMHIPRFYHFYDEKELEDDLQKAGFSSFTIKNVSLTSDGKDNYVVYLEK